MPYIHKYMICNIQKYSIHDGPGIRTAVFFKGCPLRCIWCANPETQSARAQILWDKSRCLHCFTCVGVCPAKALSKGRDRIQADHGACTACGVCADSCPGNALSLAGEARSLESVVQVCLEDKAFYEESGGGATLTGGEVLSQPDFAEALLIRLGSEGVHRTIETSGFAQPETFNRIADNTDFILFDVKHYDREQHYRLTGVYPDRIIENLTGAIACGRNTLPRLPVIPGCNDTLEDAAGFADLLRSCGAGEVQLLPFHQFGQNKYQLLGLDYALERARTLHPEDLRAFAEVLSAKGLRVIV
ncbi:MAG: glycyl-radical enzyme activating protein [Spirochaetaceae bacterium]|jgi:pyruvate formate lyase activating enzyme|nr:glycyl-radical enzyme activating protein [Spirochaetaceae bacterium]